MNYIKLIVISLFFVGCSDNFLGNHDTKTYSFELQVNLEQDINGYYHLPMNQYGDGTQTIHQFSVDTNNPHTSPPQFVYWDCDTQVENTIFETHTEMVDIINHSSYATSDGIAYTMFGPHSDQIGDTISVYVGYECNIYEVEYQENFYIILENTNE